MGSMAYASCAVVIVRYMRATRARMRGLLNVPDLRDVSTTKATLCNVYVGHVTAETYQRHSVRQTVSTLLNSFFSLSRSLLTTANIHNMSNTASAPSAPAMKPIASEDVISKKVGRLAISYSTASTDESQFDNCVSLIIKSRPLERPIWHVLST